MAAPRSPVAAYVHELARELRMRRAPRRRLLAEVEDHLRSTADELAAVGRSAAEAEREAVARFGAAAEVAHGFAHATASSTARAALAWAGAAFLAYGATALLFIATAPSWLRDFPHAAPSTLALQVAAVALAVTAVRALRWRRALVIDEERLRLVANGALIAVLAVGVGAAAELLVALTRPAAAPWSDASALIATFAAVLVLSVPAALVATTGYARASCLGLMAGRHPVSDRRDDLTLAEDVEAIVPTLGRLGHAALRRPRRTCAVLAGAAFVAVSVAQLAGSDFAHHASIVIGAVAVGALEAVAIVIGYLTLGRPLGLRKQTPANS
jgi:hypothetical protein